MADIANIAFPEIELAEAILDSLKEVDFHDYPAADTVSTLTTIDGRVDLVSVAAALKRRLKGGDLLP